MSSAIRPRNNNQLLAALAPAELERLLPRMECVELEAGATLHEAGQPLRHVYFPTTAVVSLVASMRDGATMQVAVVGKEGVVGVGAFLGGRDALCSEIVIAAGQAWRICRQSVLEHVRAGAQLMPPVMCYLELLLTQIAQTSACNRYHSIEQQLCRWLLLNLDGLDSSEVRVTQERIALMLGVRREGITVGAGRLQDAGLIRYSRGRISVLDRSGPEQRSCECYSVIRQATERLLGKPSGAAQGGALSAPRRAALALQPGLAA